MRDTPAEKPENAEVHLRPLLGIEPTTYLPILYSIVLLGILFLVLVLPGIVRSGTVFHIDSTPGGAAVLVDGVVVGTSDEPVFVPHGDRKITISKPGYIEFAEERTVSGRLFFSWFAPRRDSIAVELAAVDTQALVTAAVLDFSDWSLVGEASGQYQFPPIGRRLGGDLAQLGSPNLYDRFAANALPHVASEAQMNDLLAGYLVSKSASGAPGPLALVSVFQSIVGAASAAPGVAVQVADSVRGLGSDTIAESEWVSAAREQISALPTMVGAAGTSGARVTFAGIPFVRVEGGSGSAGGHSRAERGGDIAYRVQVDPLYVSQTEITVGDYRRFLTENPEWAPENVERLETEGLVDSDYLRDWTDGMPADAEPVRNVSAFGAEAFANWLTQNLGGGFVARLPSESEWDYFARQDAPQTGVFASSTRGGPAIVDESGRGSLGLYGIYGNLWEWTADSFASYARYHPDRRIISGNRVVRVGGWATPPGDFTVDDRGAMPPDWCSDAVGFRLVLAER